MKNLNVIPVRSKPMSGRSIETSLKTLYYFHYIWRKEEICFNGYCFFRHKLKIDVLFSLML